MTNTSVYLHNHVVDQLKKLGQKSIIEAFLQRLKSNSEILSNYRFSDPRGRIIEVKILGRHALFFFKDPYANIVKILDLRNVESL
jgi:hypothetical protein